MAQGEGAIVRDTRRFVCRLSQAFRVNAELQYEGLSRIRWPAFLPG
jgi:hypothetical protein